MEEAANRNVDQSPRARMIAMGRTYLRFAADNPAVYSLMFGKRDNVILTTPRLTMAKLAAWGQLEGQVSAMIGDLRAHYGAVTVWSALHGLAMLRLERKLPPHVEPELALEALLRTVMAGLEAEGG